MTTSSSIVGWRFVRARRLLDAQRAERDALVELHAVADHGGLADDDAGAVVDAERVADARAGVDVDAGLAVRELGDERAAAAARRSSWSSCAIRWTAIAKKPG